MPKSNEPDLRDIPLHLRSSMAFHPAENLDQVLDVSIVGGLAALERGVQAAPSGGEGGEPVKRAPRRKRNVGEAPASA